MKYRFHALTACFSFQITTRCISRGIKMKKNVISTAVTTLLFAGGMLASVAANATTVTLDPFDAAGNVTFGLTHPSVGGYIDDFLFSISPETVAHASGTAVVGATWMLPEPMDNYKIVDIKFFMVNPDSSHTDIATTFNASTLRFRPTGLLAAGDYGFEVMGMTLLPGQGGSYAGNLNVVTTPVPEPSAYLMLMVGVGLLGFAGRGKDDNKVG